MKNSKLVKMLGQLSKVELNHFRDFVYSPFYNKNPRVTELFRLLAAAYPRFRAEAVDRHVLHEKIFGNRPYNEQSLRYLMSDLTSLMEDFLAWEALKRQPVLKEHLLLGALAGYKLEDQSSRHLKAEDKWLVNYPYEDDRYYYYQFLHQLDLFNFTPQKRDITLEKNLQSVHRYLDIFYIINKLRYSAELINLTNLLAGESKPLLLNEILDYLAQNPQDDIPAISLYHKIILTLLEDQEESHYRDLIECLERYEQNLPPELLNEMYVYARNYCTKKINQGNRQYLQEIFSLYRKLLVTGLILEDGYLSQWDYKNIVAVGLRLKDYEWVGRFIREYREKLPPADRDNAYTYNLALYHYYRGEYGQTLELLRNVEFTDVYYHLDSKSLLLKTYYELQETEPLQSLIDAFYIYLKRNRLISKYQLKSYTNFLNLARRLVRLRFRHRGDPTALEAEVRASRHVPNSTWLLSRLEEIKNAH